MKRTLLSLLIVGMFAGVGTSAMAQNVTAEDQANANESADSQTNANPETAGAADQSIPNPDKNAAGDKALLEYKIAKENCDKLQGSAVGSCVTEAKATRDEALKQAKNPSIDMDKGAANESDSATPAQQQAEQQSNDMGAANESDTETPAQQQAKKASTDEEASTTTN